MKNIFFAIISAMIFLCSCSKEENLLQEVVPAKKIECSITSECFKKSGHLEWLVDYNVAEGDTLILSQINWRNVCYFDCVLTDTTTMTYKQYDNVMVGDTALLSLKGERNEKLAYTVFQYTVVR
jgi:hypothetical protein